MAKKRKKAPVITTDLVMKNIWLGLHRDLGKVLGHVFDDARDSLLKDDIPSFRANLVAPSFLNLDPYRAKCLIQVDKFLKRYRFKNDAYSDTELFDLSKEKSIRENIRIASHLLKPKRLSTWAVLRVARRKLREWLREYTVEEHRSLCRFGLNASVGSPFSKSYLDLKLCEGPLTGSRQQILWFKDYLKTDPLLTSVLRSRKIHNSDLRFKVCSVLPQTFVPKTYDKLRGITPNTLLGTFYTYGLGEMLVDRLEKLGYRLKRMQKEHRLHAKKSSKTRSLVTADLSAASDSITSTLIRMLFPSSWVRAFNLGRIQYTQIPGGPVQWSPVFAGMGIGFTFPLQSLVFLSLIKSIEELVSQKRGIISVYGDDLIYPRILHRYVVGVFTDLGFVINKEKTYEKEPFRESCGGDFYHGIDCRPVSPSGGYQSGSRNFLSSYLYKIRNNLLRKWDRDEIPSTLYWIDRNICGLSADGHILVVPPSFPDTSGVRVSNPSARDWDWFFPIARPKYNVQRQSWMFRSIRLVADERAIISCYPYYWDSMRSASLGLAPPNLQNCRLEKLLLFEQTRSDLSYSRDALPSVKWVDIKPRLKRKERKGLAPFKGTPGQLEGRVAVKGTTYATKVWDSIPSWIPLDADEDI